MRRPLKRALIAAALVTVSIVPGGPAQAAPEQDQKIYKVIPYVISDPELVKNPERVSEEFAKRMTLDHLGIQPATADGPSRTNRSRVAADPTHYVVDSSRFPGGAKPADIYDYATEEQCDDEAGRASQDPGWIKNRFSYCQIHIVYMPAVECIIPPVLICRLTGEFISVNMLRGQGKVGGHLNAPGSLRWADFLLEVEVTKATGPFALPSARLKASIECDGSYRNPVVPTDEDFACFPGLNESTEKPILQWRVDDDAYLDLLSEALPPAAENGEQIATGVFHIEYDFHLPWHFQFIDTESPEGGMRFDSAWYLSTARAEQLGSVFDRAVPGLSLNKSDSAISGAAVHIEEARANPAATVPLKDNKVLHGGSPGDTLRRLPGAKSEGHRSRLDRNRAVSTNFCRTVAMPPQPDTGGPFDCDEYAMASTYEGAARWESEGVQFILDYSVRWVNRDQNQEAGRRIGRWYDTDRLIDGDRFFIPIVDGDGGGGGGGGGVDNPPRVSAGPDRTGNEGVPVILHGVASDDRGAPAAGWSVNAGPDVDAGATCAFADASAGITTITCTDDGTFTVSLTANDGVNPAVSDSATVTLRNVAPAIGGTVLPPNPAALRIGGAAVQQAGVTPEPWQVFRAGETVTLRAPFADPGTNDTHTCTVVWDDGSTESFPGAANVCERTHTFANAGMYTVAVTVRDDDAGSHQADTMIVAYDPNAGFATAGGHIASPAGSLTGQPDAAGKGHFQFNPKYHKGDSGPSPSGGKSNFRLDGTQFRFESTHFEWLVVTPDARVALKGTGTVAGQSGYGFVLYAYDPDRYRLVVWNLATGPNPAQDKVYDNRPGGGYDVDMADPQPIQAGRISVHR